ncbi:hypothetical protein [Promicromonospora sp. NPDC057488]|uniref:hypothetical protein n=1 Tax=Promicromonospora sp. NPDC057488 TaxID=3346147 RepID=UPI00366FF3D7
MEPLPAKPRDERQVVQAAVDVLRTRLPPAWGVAESSDRADGADLILRFTSPDQVAAVVLVEAKTTLEARDVATVSAKLAGLMEAVPGSTGMVVARYLTGSVRTRLAEAGLSYADATGNVLVRVDMPGLFVSDRGADKDPWRGPGRPRGALKGEPAARVVRALLDFPDQWRIRRLVDVSGAATGSVYRVIEFLESESLVTRSRGGDLTLTDWSGLLRRWGQDYQFSQANALTRWVAPRGVEHLVDQIRAGAREEYAVTGSVAAAAWAPYAPARSVMAYAARPRLIAEEWGLRETDRGANVILAEPVFDVLTERTMMVDGLVLAAPTQVAVDLMTGPGRSPSEAEALIEWAENSPEFAAWKERNAESRT